MARGDAATRAEVRGRLDAEALRDAAIASGLDRGLRGWARADADGRVRVHAEGPPAEVEALLDTLRAAPGVEEVTATRAKVEGHEQFAARGVPAGIFVVQEHQATAHHFDVRLEVDGVLRSWAVPKGPSMDPAEKRLAVEVADHALSHARSEQRGGRGGWIVWDRGTYEQGGRVPWPEAIERGHAVFVLHGEKLRGGFALQRTGGRGERAQWLLIKRRDDEARPGSDVVAESPASALSGRTLDELLAGGEPG
jgi:DNA ligase D-like protein (predicted 3'-phosphoesterase)